MTENGKRTVFMVTEKPNSLMARNTKENTRTGYFMGKGNFLGQMAVGTRESSKKAKGQGLASSLMRTDP